MLYCFGSTAADLSALSVSPLHAISRAAGKKKKRDFFILVNYGFRNEGEFPGGIKKGKELVIPVKQNLVSGWWEVVDWLIG